MTRRAYFYFIITFIIGVILGGVGVYTYAWNTGHWRREWNERTVIHDMQKQLGLSSKQVQQLRSILNDGGKEIHDLQIQLRPQYDNLRHRIDGRIRQILNPVQMKKYNDILQKRAKARGRP